MRCSDLDYGPTILINLKANLRFNRELGVRRWVLAVYPLYQYGIVNLLVSVRSNDASYPRPVYNTALDEQG